MFLILEKKFVHLFDADGYGYFLEKILECEKKLTDEQKTVPCEVLVCTSNFSRKTKTMTMEEIVEILQGRLTCDSKYECVIDCVLEKLDKNSADVEVHHDPKLFNILANQFFEVVSIQKKLKEKIGELNLKQLTSNDVEMVEMSDEEIKNLRKIKKEQLQNANDYYEKIIEQSKKILGGLEITESELLAEFPVEKIVDMKNKIQNESSPKKKMNINVQTILDKPTMILNKSHIYTFQQDKLFMSKINILLTDDECAPRFWNNGKIILLGIATRENSVIGEKVEGFEYFVTNCPRKCTNDYRQWICPSCSNFFKMTMNPFEVVCDCGTIHVTDLKLECFDPNHPKTHANGSPTALSTTSDPYSFYA
uniref:Uncharacterized protein n=1 Tax=Panagrolaimus sp. JU765 TaxID=591449 RepID=A0AC34QEF5_9BILA